MASIRYIETESITLKAIRKGIAKVVSSDLVDVLLQSVIDASCELAADEARARFTGKREVG
jgi:hypothetical protein